MSKPNDEKKNETPEDVIKRIMDIDIGAVMTPNENENSNMAYVITMDPLQVRMVYLALRFITAVEPDAPGPMLRLLEKFEEIASGAAEVHGYVTQNQVDAVVSSSPEEAAARDTLDFSTATPDSWRK